MRVLTYIVLIFVILLGLTFACLNADSVSINYYIGSNELPLSFLLVITFALGGIIGLLVSSFVVLKLKRDNYRLRQRARVVEKEIENLRIIPMKDNR